MNKNKVFKFFKFFSVFCAVLFAYASVSAQVIDTISYVPVKQGYYDKISTKTKAQFSADSSSTLVTNLKANSSELNIITSAVSFGKPVYVKGNVFVQESGPSTSLKTNSSLKIQGQAYANGIVVATKLPNVTKVTARELNLRNRSIRLSSSSNIIIDGVSFPSPSGCDQGTEWRTVDARDEDNTLKQYVVLACKGTGSANTCNVPAADKTTCNNGCPNPSLCYWDEANCCCVGSKSLLFLDASMCAGSQTICNGNEITSATAVCNEYAADSAECICAKGNLKQCVGKVYGGGSDEAGCVQSGEYHEACTCSYFVEFQNNYMNLACTGIPALCEGSTYQPCSAGTTPATTQSCGISGTQTRTVTCNTSTGTWTTGAWGTCTDCTVSSFISSHKSLCCPNISPEEDTAGLCYTPPTWSSYGGQSIGYGGCYAPDSGTQSCMADSSSRYLCTEDTERFIPCSNDGDICACMLCGGSGSSAFINTVNYKCSISKNGW